MTTLPSLRLSLTAVLVLAPLPGAALRAQAIPEVKTGVAPKVSLYATASTLDYAQLLAPPPAPGSDAARQDLDAVHQAERSRTAGQVREAQRDDREESIFLYATLVGPHFSAEELPATALFSQHLRNESGVVNPSLKVAFHRARPFTADASLHPVCAKTESNSYPSGHAMVGYLEGFALAQMLPEKSAEILARAHTYAENRVLCGVHYPSDVEASRTVALVLFGALSTSPRFQQDLQAARKELREKLQLP